MKYRFRILQGIGNAMVFATGMAILVSVYPPQEKGKVLGINVAAVREIHIAGNRVIRDVT